MLPHASLLCRRRKPTAETCVGKSAKLWPQTLHMQRTTIGAAGNGQYTTAK
jgi:hypothetical protein